MALTYLSPMDAAFLRMETLRTPMHVGSLLTFRLADDAPPDFLRALLQQLRERPFMPAPFDCKIARTRWAKIAPAWKKTRLDMEFHVRHSALPYPGGERELGALVARLHSRPLDLSRPLWEATLIEGLENNRFALYFKAHHCAIDGMGAMRMVQNWLTTDPHDRSGPGPVEKSKKPGAPKTRGERFRDTYATLRENARAAADLARALKRMGEGATSSVRAARETPRSMFNVRISQQRRLATQRLELARFKAVGAATETSVNDVTLAALGGAVRRYLLEHSALPEKSLTASVPIGLQRSSEQIGNAVAGFVCPLGTDEPDPLKRLALIHAVTVRSKDELQSMSPTMLKQYALMGLSPLMLGQMTGTLAKLPPLFSFTVSNVVLGKNPLYLKGAQLEAMYPISFLNDGYCLNVTLVGYTDRIAFGFIGCRDAIPHLQRLAVYTGEALGELEAAVGVAQPAKPHKAKTKAKAKAKKKP